eukprot:gene15835-biopygen5223
MDQSVALTLRYGCPKAMIPEAANVPGRGKTMRAWVIPNAGVGSAAVAQRAPAQGSVPPADVSAPPPAGGAPPQKGESYALILHTL